MMVLGIYRRMYLVIHLQVLDCVVVVQASRLICTPTPLPVMHLNTAATTHTRKYSQPAFTIKAWVCAREINAVNSLMHERQQATVQTESADIKRSV